jgi:hypothetical protein
MLRAGRFLPGQTPKYGTMADASQPAQASRKLPPSRGIFLSLVVVAATLLLIELGARSIGWDFAPEKRNFERTPIFYRQPIQPVGPAFFRRPGPARWRGQVLRPMLNAMNASEPAYRDEPTVIIEYDAEGFRNPANLEDWEVAVAGDSLTELGFLPYEDLFTTVAGRLLGLRVKNLGVSHTGTLTQTFYLRAYGKSPGTRHAVLGFFEGNDLYDIEQEESRLQRAKAGVYAPADVYKFRSERSAIRFLYEAICSLGSASSWRPVLGKKVDYANAVFHGAGGDIPVTLAYAPPASSNLPPEWVARLDRAVAGWAEAASELQLKPWLLYLPCKERVLYGRATVLPSAPANLVRWKPTDLPDLVRSLCGKHGIKFIDATEDLCRLTSKGLLTYNTICDSHLNKQGSHCVGRTLAAALAAATK